jgi:DNA end-binding protein Ku
VARALWTGAIAFGLVEIPVSLYSGEEPGSRLDLDLLDRRDSAHVGYERVNKETGERVEWKDIVKGYAYRRGEYVLFSDAELENAAPEATKTIEIAGFVERDAVEPLFYEKPYYLAPAKKSRGHSYGLLRAALEKSEMIGIATVVLRTRQHVAALYVSGDALVLDTLRYADEVRDPAGLGLPKRGRLPEKEVSMAVSLVRGMAMEWRPEDFRDEYQDAILALVKEKVAAGTVAEVEDVKRPRRTAPKETLDLMPLLQESVRAQRGTKAKKAAPKRRRKAG